MLHRSGTNLPTPCNRACANNPEIFVTDTARPSALREWRAHLGNRTVWLACAGVAVVVAMVGPFDTDEVMNLPTRFAYWGVVVPISYAIGAFAGMVVAPMFSARMPRPVTTALAAVLAGILIFVFIALLNAAVFGLRVDLSALPQRLLLFIAIAGVISFLIDLLPSSGTASPSAKQAPPLLDRLPLEKRGRLRALSSEDHYTRIRTAKGEELVLIRLADAIREAAPEPGLQVHRSHWVALSAVTAARRDGDRAILTLEGDTEIPVSRANVAAVKDAGLLPR